MTALVIGAGMSGLATAWALAEAGRAVTLVQGRAGASHFASGVYDFELWDEQLDTTAVSPEAKRFLSCLGASMPASGVWVATCAGVIRPALGLDDALLNLESLAGKSIGVVDISRPGWDAESLARSYQASDWAGRTKTRFAAVAIPLEHENATLWRQLSPLDWAAELGQGQAGCILVEALRKLAAPWGGFLLGPWLASTTQQMREWKSQLDRPWGETVSEPGCTAGERFASARQQLLTNPNIECVQGEANALKLGSGGWKCEGQFEPGSQLATRHFSHAVLAVGGVVGGGVRFLSGEEQKGGRSFSLSLKAPVHLRLRRREVAVHSGSQGVDLQALGMDALTRVGVSVGRGHRVDSQPGLFAIGDVVADRPRTALVAIESGLVAASQILSE